MKMENLSDLWKNLNLEFENNEISEKSAHSIASRQSGMLLAQIGRKLKYGLYWNLFFLILLLVPAIIHFNNKEILSLVSLLFIVMLGNFLYGGQIYLKIIREPILLLDTKTMLEIYISRVQQGLKFERTWSQFSIPLSLIAGYLYAQLLKHGSFSSMVFEPPSLLVVGILMVIAVPLVILWVGWSQKYAFKDDLDKLREEIRDLSGPDEATE
jgi:hypothetical protein